MADLLIATVPAVEILRGNLEKDGKIWENPMVNLGIHGSIIWKMGKSSGKYGKKALIFDGLAREFPFQKVERHLILDILDNLHGKMQGESLILDGNIICSL